MEGYIWYESVSIYSGCFLAHVVALCMALRRCEKAYQGGCGNLGQLLSLAGVEPWKAAHRARDPGSRDGVLTPIPSGLMSCPSSDEKQAWQFQKRINTFQAWGTRDAAERGELMTSAAHRASNAWIRDEAWLGATTISGESPRSTHLRPNRRPPCQWRLAIGWRAGHESVGCHHPKSTVMIPLSSASCFSRRLPPLAHQEDAVVHQSIGPANRWSHDFSCCGLRLWQKQVRRVSGVHLGAKEEHGGAGSECAVLEVAR